jgi:hypothetical protein
MKRLSDKSPHTAGLATAAPEERHGDASCGGMAALVIPSPAQYAATGTDSPKPTDDGVRGPR